MGYHISKRKIKYYYTYYNHLIFRNNLPHYKHLHIFLHKRKKSENWAEFVYYIKNVKGKKFAIIFKTNKFPSRKFFLEILLHEMIHLVDTLDTGVVTGHGESFMRWRKKLLAHGFLLRKHY